MVWEVQQGRYCNNTLIPKADSVIIDKDNALKEADVTIYQTLERLKIEKALLLQVRLEGSLRDSINTVEVGKAKKKIKQQRKIIIGVIVFEVLKDILFAVAIL